MTPTRARFPRRPFGAPSRLRETASSLDVGALAVGVAALELGAGRRTKEDAIDPAVGVLCFAKRGDAVLAGDDLAEVHAQDEAAAEIAADAILAAYTIADEAPAARGIVLEVIS